MCAPVCSWLCRTPPRRVHCATPSTPLANHTYWMFFANPNKIVKPGDLVNLQIGDFAVEGIVVM